MHYAGTMSHAVNSPGGRTNTLQVYHAMSDRQWCEHLWIPPIKQDMDRLAFVSPANARSLFIQLGGLEQCG